MVISRTRLATAKMVFWFVLSWTLCSILAYRFLRSGGLDWGEELVVITGGMIIGFASAMFELFAVPGLTRRYGAGAMIVIRALGYILCLAVFVHAYTFPLFGVVAGDGVWGFLRSDRYQNFVTDGRFALGVLGLTLMSFLISFVWQVNRMLGPGMLLALLFGRYRRPVTEERIFMFLDLKNSTAIAERLGDVRFNGLKNDFYYDLSEPVLQTRGRIYEYVGDEVVITWTYRDGLRDGNCVRCFFLIEREVQRSREAYLARYGVVPEFKAALHSGPVVTSEIGDLRKSIVHSGDTVNTTARIEGMCRPLGHRLLISASLLSQLPEDLGLELRDLGYVKLRGKEVRMHLYSILGPDADAAEAARGTTPAPRLSEVESHGGGRP